MALTKEQQAIFNIVTALKFEDRLITHQELQTIKHYIILRDAIIDYQVHKRALDNLVDNIYEQLYNLSIKDYTQGK